MRGIVTGALVLLAACSGAQAERVQLSGRYEQRVISVGAFDKIELKGPDPVIVHVGAAQSVSIAGHSAVIDRMNVTVENGKLVIEREGRFLNMLGPKEGATVTVTAPRLVAASVSGSGEMTVDQVGGGDFTAAVGGAGQLRVGRTQAGVLNASVGGSGDLSLGQVDAASATLAVGGSGTIDVSGRTGTMKTAIGGSGDISASKLRARTAEISAAGSGDTAVHASDTATISVAGSGSVVVHGGARCTISKVGSGSVRCEGAS